MRTPLEGKVAVVTGAAGAIGTQICTRLHAMGARLVLVDLREGPLLEAARRYSGDPLSVAVDLSAPGAVEQVLQTVRERAGRCDILVNNAGTVVTEPFEHSPVEPFVREIQVNLVAPMLLIHAFLPMLRETRGQVITIVSLGGQLPLKECPGYCASKFGLRGLMLSLAARQPLTGVSFSVINPASIDTPLVRHEAIHGGSALNFLSPPHPPAIIGDAVARRVLKPRVESDVPAGDGWLIRLVMAVPGLFVRLLPWFEARGERGRQRFLRDKGLLELAQQNARKHRGSAY